MRLDLCKVVRECVVMLKPLLKSRVKFTVTLPDEPIRVMGQSGRLQQVIVNRFTNARDAILPDGRIELEVGIDGLAVGESSDGSFAHLVVRDSGHGMDEETLRQIWEPFFATKQASQGTGLELTTVKQLVQAHGGKMQVDSIIDQGTTFKILLEVHQQPQAVGRPVKSSPVRECTSCAR